jgi:hypothetical protein
VRFLQAAVKEIADRKEAIPADSFRSHSFEPGWQEKHMYDVGRVQGLQEALDIILNITRADERDD